MKKFLLSVAAVFGLAAAANAQTEVYEMDYSTVDKFPFYVMGYEPEIVDGVLVATNPMNEDGSAAWYQFFIADGIPTTVGQSYTATIKMKASEAGSAALNMGWGWGDGEQINSSISFPTEWQEVSSTFESVGGASCNLVLQPGTYTGKIEIEWVKVALAGEVKIPTPEEGEVLASFFTGNGEEFGGWGATAMEPVEEDGKPCLKIVNEEAKEDWAAQVCINYDFTPGVTYYLNFDVKGTPFKGIPSGFQGEIDYAGCGNMNKFNVTEEWANVTIYGEAFNAGSEESPNLPKRWLANVGKFVGTMYMTNVKLYVEKGNAIQSVEMMPVQTGVYNLLGVKVADSLEGVAPGMYIANGKKVVVRK